MPPKKQKKSKDADEKKVRKKGKATVAGGFVGMGRQELSSDSRDPEMDIDRAIDDEGPPPEVSGDSPIQQASSAHQAKGKESTICPDCCCCCCCCCRH